MLSFAEFLTERFHSGSRSGLGYAEIWANPTNGELSLLSKRNPHHELGGIISGATLYVWDREVAMHHDIRATLKLPSQALPLYLEYNHADQSVRVALASFSASIPQQMYSPDRILAICRKHPAFKVFTDIDYR